MVDFLIPAVFIRIYNARGFKRAFVTRRYEQAERHIGTLGQRPRRHRFTVIAEYPLFAVTGKSLGFTACAEFIAVYADARNQVLLYVKAGTDAECGLQCYGFGGFVYPSAAHGVSAVGMCGYNIAYGVTVIAVESAGKMVESVFTAVGSAVYGCKYFGGGAIYVRNVHGILL